ncbi:helix-turn-helix domain-containing protein [Streptomyces sp. ARC14]
MNRSGLGAALRILRESSGLEAKAVARSAAMSRSKLSKIETGSVAPSITDVDCILSALGVSDEVKAEYMAAAREAATEVTAWRLVRRLGYSSKQQAATGASPRIPDCPAAPVPALAHSWTSADA